MFRIAPDKSESSLPPEIPTEMPEATDVEPMDSASQPDLGVDSLAKVDQTKVNYLGPESGPFACSNCSFWSDPNACQIVSGEIAPEGLCNLFTPLSNQEGSIEGAEGNAGMPPEEAPPEIK